VVAFEKAGQNLTLNPKILRRKRRRIFKSLKIKVWVKPFQRLAGCGAEPRGLNLLLSFPLNKYLCHVTAGAAFEQGYGNVIYAEIAASGCACQTNVSD
jgi:hypothetical protein